MLHSPITTSSPLLPLAGCTNPTVAFAAKSASRPISASLSRQGSSAAVNIPSPPLTPYLGSSYFSDEDGVAYHHISQSEQDGIFSSSYHRAERDQQQQQDTTSMLRHSTSAPTMMSSLWLRASPSTPSLGFTFSSNISMDQPKEDRESYAYFLNKMEQNYWKSVSTIRSTYFFDGIGRGGGFLAIPHIASHGNAKTNVICRLLEAWLTKKLVEPTISDSIPVLEDSIQSSVQSIERHLKTDPKIWAGISQAFIHIQCGHVFMLDACCDDETIVHLGADEFYQDYPLFVDVEIKMQGESAQQPRRLPTEVLIAFQNVVNHDKGPTAERPYVHRAYISESLSTMTSNCSSTTSSRRQSLDARTRA